MWFSELRIPELFGDLEDGEMRAVMRSVLEKTALSVTKICLSDALKSSRHAWAWEIALHSVFRAALYPASARIVEAIGESGMEDARPYVSRGLQYPSFLVLLLVLLSVASKSKAAVVI